MKSFHH